jgi:hypothetical protein
MTNLQVDIEIINNSLADKFFVLQITSPANSYSQSFDYAFCYITNPIQPPPSARVYIGGTIAETNTEMYLRMLIQDYAPYPFISVTYLNSSTVRLIIYDTDATATITSESGIPEKITFATTTIPVVEPVDNPFQVVNCRTPYFITVNEPSQTASRIEIYLWNRPYSEPATPTVQLTNDYNQATNRANEYNISSYIQSYIENIAPNTSEIIQQDEDKMWCYCTVKSYFKLDGEFALLDTYNIVGLYGYNSYLAGYNQSNTNDIQLLTPTENVIYFNRDAGIPYVNILVNHTGDNIEVVWSDADETFNETILSSSNSNRVYLMSVPVTPSYQNLTGKSTMTINNISTETVIGTYNVEDLCEKKYEPILCSFINRFGGWNFITFFKANSQTITTKGIDYNLLPDSIDYNPQRGQKKRFNIVGNKTIKVNTGWVDENYDDLITDLYLSETILLDGVPVVLKTQSTPLKTYLKDKVINYTVEFDYAYNLINNVL